MSADESKPTTSEQAPPPATSDDRPPWAKKAYQFLHFVSTGGVSGITGTAK